MIERLLAAERALADGQLDQAERLFAQVADADERNAIAVAGLAEVALARGDAGLARELAARALAIDPDDAAAARLAAAPAPVAEDVTAAATPGVAATTAATTAVTAAASTSVIGRLGAWLRRLVGRGA
jgi:putative thioredoxin